MGTFHVWAFNGLTKHSNSENNNEQTINETREKNEYIPFDRAINIAIVEQPNQ